MKNEYVNKIKKDLFSELEIVTNDNNKLRYTKYKNVIHWDEFENKNSVLGWYISWERNSNGYVDEDKFEIRSLNIPENNKNHVFEKMLEVLDEPKLPLGKLSSSISAAITDINNNVIVVCRNLKSLENSNKKTENHAEQICLREIENLQLPIVKMKIYVSLIPCIECFKKIYENKKIEEIIYLKDYRTSLVLMEHNNYTKTLKNKRNYSISMISNKNNLTRKICFHHDAYILKTRINDLLEKKWFSNLSDEGMTTIDISNINYNDFEKIVILSKYLNKDEIKLKSIGSNYIEMNKTKIKEKLSKFEKLYKNGKGKNNKLVKKLEEIYSEN